MTQLIPCKNDLWKSGFHTNITNVMNCLISVNFTC